MTNSKYFVVLIAILITACSLEKNKSHSKIIEERQHMAGYHLKGFKKNAFKIGFVKKENKAFNKIASNDKTETTELQTTSFHKEKLEATDYPGLCAGSSVPLEANKVSILSLSNSSFKEEQEIGGIENSDNAYSAKSRSVLNEHNDADSGSINWTKDLPYQRKASKRIDADAHNKIIKDTKLLRTVFTALGIAFSVLAPFSLGLTFLLAIPFFVIANNRKKKLRAQERQLLVEHGSKEELQKAKQQHLSDFEANHKISKTTRIITLVSAFLMFISISLVLFAFLASALALLFFGYFLFALAALVGLIASIINIIYRSKARHNYRTAEMASKKLGEDIPTKTQMDNIDNEKNGAIIALIVSLALPVFVGIIGLLIFASLDI